MQGLGKAEISNLITPILLLFGSEHIMLLFGWVHILVVVDGNHLLSAFLLAIGLQALVILCFACWTMYSDQLM